MSTDKTGLPPDEIEWSPDDSEVILLSEADVEPVLTQLSLSTRAGLPLASGLRALAEETRSSSTRRALRQLAERLERGESLGDVLSLVGSRLSPSLRALLRHGAELGQLDTLLYWTVERTRRSIELRRALWLALTYPLFLVFAAVDVGAFLLFYITPQFTKIFEDFGTELPGLTLAIVEASRFGSTYWLQCLTVVLALFAGLFAFLQLNGAWLVTRRWSGRIPLIGPLFRLAALSEFCQLLAVFVEARMPLPLAILSAGEAADDLWLRGVCCDLAQDLSEGHCSEAFVVTAGLPAALAHVLRETASPQVLAEALRGLSEIFAARTAVNSRLMMGIIEPFIMVGTAVGLGTLVIALFLPLINLMNDLS